MDLKLAGKKVLISGGSKGIGRAAVDIFAEEGAIVSFCARSQEEVSAAEQAANQLGSGSVYGSVVDVGDEAQLQAWVESAAKTMGGIDVVVANVSALAIPSTKENWEASFNVDLMHTVRMVEAAMPLLQESEHASIVTVSSVSGREVDFASGPYGTMKTAIIAYTQGLANQLASSGIRANSVSPGNTYFPGGTALPLTQRIFTCESCGYTDGRDRNAAKVILAQAQSRLANVETIRHATLPPGELQRAR